MSHDTEVSGPDLSQGIPRDSLADGAMVQGHVGDEAVLLARRGDEVFAVGATCTHYGGPLADGLLVGDSVRCPWHHACFSLRTGAAECAPALNPLPCWRVEARDGKWLVGERLASPSATIQPATTPQSIVIIGGGAAGNAAAETLRQQGYAGRLTMLSADEALPCDRPNLSKNYLAGTAPEEWIPLRSADFYREQNIDLQLQSPVAAIDTQRRRVALADGSHLPYDALLIATGSEPVRLKVPGAELPHVHYLRSFADCRRLIAGLADARQAVVVGAGFIGLEVAAALRQRGIDVHVVAPDAIPMARILGPELGNFLRQLHEQNGVVFHLGDSVTTIDESGVTLASGARLAADCVVVGIGVKPALALAEQAGLAIDRGIAVDRYLQTSAPGVFAAGDVARWPAAFSGEAIRVEHWVVAERQGQTAARNMLGAQQPFVAVPFFWTEQHCVALSYVGHAENWERIEIDGEIAARDCRLTYWRGDRKLAVVTIGRDGESLRAEVEFEKAAGIV
ncbi:MAG: pyridine nucleotide-disulfide oxidoreductase [Proteobacteria bacterium]|nr:pyridine nucleotide-disulfide oxidoreductase [Pseudomonadota bacterium]